ncbi:cache domain-containing protein [Geobacter sp. SVR]|uniref:cache domain-containing protein n=1 Tax=Geobacter sp. SVR TaxID=2495594 RepID=UPI00143EFE38|nr:cache domain-containing protein [Geobacter sp. SVR]BCS52209.1 two-component sensor histidine kinase [Geobacter sp. SVR]GCF85129.1 two-component sensor histidine kinase [Geobacter sp. SVR]
MGRPRVSIRLKLTIGALLPLFVAILFCSLAGISLINSRIDAQAQEKVRTDLNSAREVYNNEIAHLRNVVRFSAGMPFIAKGMVAGDRERIADLLSSLRHNERLDILTAVDRSGRVLFRAGNPDDHGDLIRNDPLPERALKGEVTAGTALFPPERLTLEGIGLADMAAIDVIPTERARPGVKTTERSGMLLVAAAPVRDSTGRIAGALYGGILLNRNNSLVDKIKRIVYEGVRFEGQDVGTATIFLDDTRISTNVQTKDGNRAIGTRLSAEVYDRVILNRQKWVHRAFVVNDWYFSAYEPILDLRGEVIGSLYVGMRERPNTALKMNVGLLFGAVLLGGSLFGLALSGYIGSRLARPIRELQHLVKRFSAGERDLHIGGVTSNDEIGDLAAEFNAMTATLIRREAEIREFSNELERKVRERTAELEEKNRLLTKAREELVRAEKLAAVGELAAGVAHEINNPMAIIRGNSEVLLMELPPGHPNREEAEIIARQVVRVKEIVGNLLSFARRKCKSVKRVEIEPVLDDILRQVRHQVPLEGIELRREFPPHGTTEIDGDENQLRQVFTNLIVNGLQSMEQGGTLTVRTGPDRQPGFCRLEIEDTGTGIPQERIRDIFTPFFTTKQTGTGLGLSVSYGIVRNHGGEIGVQSEPGHGSRFTVTLPVRQTAAQA